MNRIVYVAAHPLRGWQITTAEGQCVAFHADDEAHEAIEHARRLAAPGGRVVIDAAG